MADVIGTFEGDVVTKWLTDVGYDRDMELVEEFAFVDSAGKRWVAVTSTVVNGASIPNALWSAIVGTPYIGDYRRATVLHDAYYRDPRGETRKAVDEMFLEAMLTDGVPEERAKIMYAAVRVFGRSAFRGEPEAVEGVAPARPQWAEFQAWYEMEGAATDLDEIDAALNERFGVPE